MLTPKRNNEIFEMEYKLMMHPTKVTHDEMFKIALTIRDLRNYLDGAQRDAITYREQVRKLSMENAFLNDELARQYEDEQ